MQQNMTEAQKLFVRLNPTVGYGEKRKISKIFAQPVEESPLLGLSEQELEFEIEVLFTLELVTSEATIERRAAEKEIDDLLFADPTWLDLFDAEAEASFEMSFTELDAAPVRRRVLKRGAA